ncbi:hypothetical protein FIBSPDRAFT_255018 [Athelia psychrophila]|uniref:BTB domain-containing protein n=1 Tax=Athelia psychrophila TaxID=1759441 RepID=A0A165XP41_9AGAM|nr:hypothetical protein FIBSPDRAFT_255018 [Fibularhizoctonia sp. CBS 109695]
MSSDSTRPIKPISPIFSINSKADVIVRSSDDIDFYVSRYFLAYASPVFEGLFSIPSPPSPAAAEDSDETKEGVQGRERACRGGGSDRLHGNDEVLTV